MLGQVPEFLLAVGKSLGPRAGAVMQFYRGAALGDARRAGAQHDGDSVRSKPPNSLGHRRGDLVQHELHQAIVATGAVGWARGRQLGVDHADGHFTAEYQIVTFHQPCPRAGEQIGGRGRLATSEWRGDAECGQCKRLSHGAASTDWMSSS